MKLSLVVLSLVIAQSLASDKLLLSVYYESKCPDSRRFIVDQLVPTVHRLQDYLQLKLVPFGKAKSTNGGTSFECQHGPTECRGNLVQDCAIASMTDRSDDEIVEYVACEMQSLAGTVGNFECVQNAKVPVQSVQRCLKTRQGLELQLLSEHLTKLVSPKFVPTVTFNGQFDQHLQNESIRNLFETVCSLIPDAEPCGLHYNHAALQSIYRF